MRRVPLELLLDADHNVVVEVKLPDKSSDGLSSMTSVLQVCGQAGVRGKGYLPVCRGLDVGFVDAI